MADADGMATGRMYCRDCGCDLRAQAGPDCPDCGRSFNPAKRRTFRSRPPRGSVWRWGRRALILLLSLVLPPALCWGWLYWGWKAEQVAMARMGAEAGKVDVLGGHELEYFLNSVGETLGVVRQPPRRRSGGGAFVDHRVTDTPPVLHRAWQMGLDDPSATDAEFVHIEKFQYLWRLSIQRTQITDAGLVHLKSLKRLRELCLDNTSITDAGLVHVKEIKGIDVLELRGTKITDAGLIHVKELRWMRVLDLSDTRVADAGLVHLIELKGLSDLDLAGTRVTDAGLAYLKQIKNLASLDLAGTQITDAGLVHFKDFTQLGSVNLERTKVTKQGLEKLRAELPRLSVEPEEEKPEEKQEGQ